MALTIKHAKTDTISDWTQPDLDAQIALGNYPPGTVLADIVLPSDWNNDHTFTGTLGVSNGGTGATTLTGYVKGSGTSAFTASSTVPNTDITGLGTMSTQNANAVAITGGTMSGVTVTGYIPTTDRGIANGVASLDGSGTVPVSQLPAAVLGALSYQGTWNASTNTPTLASSTGTKGYYYVVNVAGSTNLNGITDWVVGDWAVYNGSAWQKIDNTDAVTSVNGYTGTVVLSYGDITSGVVPVVNGGTGVTTSTGTTNVVLSGSPTIVTPVIAQINDSNGNAELKFSAITSAVNQVTIENAATGNPVHISATGTDTSIGIHLAPKGASGYVNVQGGVDNTKRFMFNPDGGTTSTRTMLSTSQTVDRTLTLPDATDTLIGKATTDTLTNKSISGSTNALSNIGNSSLINSAITINGTSTSLGGSISVGTVTSVTGTAPVVSSGGTTPAISMAAASSTVNGYLTSTDWTTFNSKGSGTVTSVSATSPVTSTGGATPTIAIPAATTSVNGYLTSTDWTTFNNKGSGTVTSVAALTLGTTGTDLTSTVATGTTTPVITLNVPTASASNRGALSSADWTTFNNKGSGSVTAVSVASANGFAGTSSGGATPALTLTTSITGVLKGNATAISAATSGTDYSAGTSALATGILKSTTTTGALSIAVSGTDFCAATSGSSVLKGSSGNTTAATAGTDYVAPGTATTFTATQTFNGSSSTLAAVFANAAETTTVSATAATGTINFDVTTQSVLYYTTNASANFTMNFRGSSGTSLNTAMATGQTVTVVFLNTNGTTAYYNNAVTIDGNSVTPKYQGGSAWTSGNASAIDAYSFTIIKTGSAAFTVLTSQTQFK